MADLTLDLTGLRCPLPVLKAKKAMRDLAPGEVVEVIATDPAAPGDFAAFCREAGHRLLDSSEAEETYRLVIEKG